MLPSSCSTTPSEAGLFGDLAQGGLRERLALLDAALGQAPDRAAGRADEAHLDAVVRADDDSSG